MASISERDTFTRHAFSFWLFTVSSFDVLRAHLWPSGKGDLRSFPPTEDTFSLGKDGARRTP